MHDPAVDIRIDRLLPYEAHLAAVVHGQAFPNHFLSSLGPAFLTEYYRSVSREPDAIALAARTTGGLIGLCVGSPDPRGFYTRLLARRWWRFAPLAAFAAIRNPSRTLRLLRGVRHASQQVERSDVCGLFSLAVAPDAQRRGVGSALVEAFIAQSMHDGCTQVVLETDNDDNERVNLFYERLGFALNDRFTTPEGRHMRRYVMNLRDAETDGGS